MLVIGGDVAHSFELVKLFFDKISAKIDPSKIVVVLGNHELWDNTEKAENAHELSSTITLYREYFKSIKINYLQNDLLVYRDYKSETIPENQILTMTDNELQSYSRTARIMIFGGIGFSGLNPTFNASTGIYQNLQMTLDEERSASAMCDRAYQKLKNSLAGKKLIVLTHMPISNWSSDDQLPDNWHYISGHTHRNYFDAERRQYADNQIGYVSNSIHLKFFEIDTNFDYFSSYGDGIYTITKEEYLLFNRGVGRLCNCKREGKYHLIKRAGISMFFLETSSKLKILNGGQITQAKHDLQYYYEKLPLFAEKVDHFFDGYFQTQRRISDFVKKIGGTGRIHGCIIDVNYYNHLFLNPYDGTIVPYYAVNIVDKLVYPDIHSLLKSDKLMLEKFNQHITEIDPNDKALMLAKRFSREVKEYSTDIYRISRIILKYQYMRNYKVLVTWKDELLAMDFEKVRLSNVSEMLGLDV